jgi:hypothetical protein
MVIARWFARDSCEIVRSKEQFRAGQRAAEVRLEDVTGAWMVLEQTTSRKSSKLFASAV